MTDLLSSAGSELLKEALSQGQMPYVDVASNSMEPLLRRGDQVQLCPASVDQLSAGDIVVLDSEDGLLAHRFWGIIEINGSDCLITRGDRLAHYDSPEPLERLQAIVTARRRAGSTLELTGPPGVWLNRVLTKLSALEARAMGLSLPTPGQVTFQARKMNLFRRALRRALSVTAAILATLVDRFSPGTSG